jgi:hypothetical protein
MENAIQVFANESGIPVVEINSFVEESLAKKAKEIRKQEKKDREVARKIELGIARVGDVFSNEEDLYDDFYLKFFQLIEFKGKAKGSLSCDKSTTAVFREIAHMNFKPVKDSFIGGEQNRRIDISDGSASIPALGVEKIIL